MKNENIAVPVAPCPLCGCTFSVPAPSPRFNIRFCVACTGEWSEVARSPVEAEKANSE